MATINIKVVDNTVNAVQNVANFSVLVFGKVNPDKATVYEKAADENGILEVKTTTDFETYIGKPDSTQQYDTFTAETGADPDKSYGRKFAYELIKLGYTILYKKIDKIADIKNEDYLSDKAAYNFRFVLNGIVAGHEEQNKAIAEITKKRGDAVALIDVDITDSESETGKKTIEKIKEEAAKYSAAGRTTGLFAPTVHYNNFDEKYDQFSAGFHYLACFAKALAANTPEWFATAGYTRGVSDFSIRAVDVVFGDAAVNELAGRTAETVAVNLIEKVRNNYYLYGNRTAHQIGSTGLVASDFLNITQLAITLSKQLYENCKRFTFDPNSQTLWINFVNAIRPTLERMRANQGIDDYEILRVNANERATLKALIRIVPIEAVEDFDITVTLEDSLGGTATDITVVDTTTGTN